MSKKLNTASVINELRGESAFFRPPVGPSSQGEMRPARHDAAQDASKRIFPPPLARQVASPASTSVQPNEGAADRTTGRNGRRGTVRHAFEFYGDQICRLKEMRRKALIEDHPFSMSEVVRAALDHYLAQLEASDPSYDRPVERPSD
jgi:hypothetical protein